jgi:hypothetical protein
MFACASTKSSIEGDGLLSAYRTLADEAYGLLLRFNFYYISLSKSMLTWKRACRGESEPIARQDIQYWFERCFVALNI